MTYEIYEGFFPELKKKLNRIKKKCEKTGNDFSFEVIGEEIKDFIDNKGNKSYYKFFIVNVSGVAIINGWQAVAVLDCTFNGNIVHKLDNVEIPNCYYNSPNVCDHCKSERNRKNLFVIYNKETNEWKQVGKNCLEIYTGGLDAEYVTAYYDGITQFEKYNNIDYEDVIKWNHHYYNVKTIIAYAFVIINKMGTYYNSSCDIPTKLLVKEMLINNIDKAIYNINKYLKNAGFNCEFSDSDFCLDEDDSIVTEIINYYNSLKDNNDFVHNVQVMLKDGYVDIKNAGYLCYLPKGYSDYKEKLKQNQMSHWFGEVGKRYKNLKINYWDVIASWSNEYGMTFIYKIVLVSGDILIWKTNKDISECDTISFTVKEHKEYNGVKQTEITRGVVK